MLNGDHPPSRRLSQNETINKIASAKISQSPENTIGLVFMAGSRSEVIISHTREAGEIMRALHAMKLKGNCDLLVSLKVAQLVLKNRNDRNQRQRIIMFVGSPVNREEKELEHIGKFLKKNGVALDLIQLGYENGENDNTQKLQKLFNSVNSSDNSHFINFSQKDEDVVKGTLDVLIGAVPSSQDNMEEMDPELAMALRMSLADQQADQNAKSEETAPVSKAEKVEIIDPEDEELAKAIAMSLDTNSGSAEKEAKTKKDSDKEMIDKKKTNDLLRDKEYLGGLIDSLPGLKKESFDLDAVIKEVFSDEEEEEKKKKLKKTEDKDEK